MNSKRNLLINKVNWNILVALGKEIKRDFMNSVNENEKAYKVKWYINCLNLSA